MCGRYQVITTGQSATKTGQPISMVKDSTFNVIPDIEDFFDVDFDFLEEDEESEEEEVFNVGNDEGETRCCSARPQLR